MKLAYELAEERPRVQNAKSDVDKLKNNIRVTAEDAVTRLTNFAGYVEYLYDMEQSSAKARLPVTQRKVDMTNLTTKCKTESGQVQESFVKLSTKLNALKPEAEKVIASHLLFMLH
jgi:hypothetical protein